MTDPSADGSGESFTEAVGAAWEVGLPLQLEGLFAGERRRRVALPTYPFERQRYWIERGVRRHGPADHPLLGVRTELASGDIVYETEMSTRDPAWLNDHRLFGKPVAQGALYGVLAATAADPPDGVVAVDGLQIHAPLILEVERNAENGSSDRGPGQRGRNTAGEGAQSGRERDELVASRREAGSRRVMTCRSWNWRNSRKAIL